MKNPKSKTYQKGRMGVWDGVPSVRQFSGFFKNKAVLGLNFCFIMILWREQETGYRMAVRLQRLYTGFQTTLNVGITVSVPICPTLLWIPEQSTSRSS